MASKPEEPRTRSDARLSRATPADAPALQALVNAAYTKYISRIGRPPAPMKTDYAALIASPGEYHVHMLRAGPVRDSDVVVGALVLADHAHDDAVHVDNLVVDPAAQGRGYGRLLMNVAEKYAWAQKRSSLTLHTNEKMVENLAIYAKMGFVEVDRRVEDGYHRLVQTGGRVISSDFQPWHTPGGYVEVTLRGL